MLAQLGKSDHVVVLLELQVQLLEDKPLPSFSWFYQKTRRSELVEAATMANWHQISSLESVTDMWHTLRDWILDLRNRLVTIALRKPVGASRGLDHDIDGRGRRNRFALSFLKLTNRLLLVLSIRSSLEDCRS